MEKSLEWNNPSSLESSLVHGVTAVKLVVLPEGYLEEAVVEHLLVVVLPST